MRKNTLILELCVLYISIQTCINISSPIPPFMNYPYSVELEHDAADLFWTVDDVKQEIIFEFHVYTTGWISFGVSPTGSMRGADVMVGWVESSGNVFLQDRYSFGRTTPVMDNTTQDWFLLHGVEKNDWTAIQFKRAFDTCDPMDYPIERDVNYLIYAYGPEDLSSTETDAAIPYHTYERRGSLMISLRSYANSPTEEKYAHLDRFELRLNNNVVPSNDTTCYCRIFKVPNEIPIKRHAIAYKAIIEPSNIDLVRRVLLYECNPIAIFDENRLPDGLCDDIYDELSLCSSSIAIGWALGKNHMVEFPEEAGFPVGGDFSIKYYMIKVYYNNPKLSSARRDSSGIRLYLSNELRKYDLGYLTLGTSSTAMALAIPPNTSEFIVNSFCPPMIISKMAPTGITVVDAFSHTHVQGIKIWTKLIRNNTAVQYLLNAESYDFNYQFNNYLRQPIKIYPGDAFAVQCVYNTNNKNTITLGGLRTKDEMCLHIVTYYPRMNEMYECTTTNHLSAWQSFTNNPKLTDHEELKHWLSNITWTNEKAARLQEFYNNTSLMLIYGGSNHIELATLPNIPIYKDLPFQSCAKFKS